MPSSYPRSSKVDRTITSVSGSLIHSSRSKPGTAGVVGVGDGNGVHVGVAVIKALVIAAGADWLVAARVRAKISTNSGSISRVEIKRFFGGSIVSHHPLL